MSRVVRLAAVFPGDLNLNGDQANLTVLKKRLEERGVSAVIETADLDKLEIYDLVFVGHGSEAAWHSILQREPELGQKISALTNFVFMVGNANEKLSVEVKSAGEHRSEFVEIDGVVGYLNSATQEPLVQYSSKFLRTYFHGPVLAKNPDLADRIIADCGWADVRIRTEKLDVLDALAQQSRKTAFDH